MRKVEVDSIEGIVHNRSVTLSLCHSVLKDMDEY